MRIKVLSVKDKYGNDRKDKFYPATIGQYGEVVRMTAGEIMLIKMDIVPGEPEHRMLKTSLVNEISERKENITVRTENSVYQLEVVKRE